MDKKIENEVIFHDLSIFRDSFRNLKTEYLYIQRVIDKNSNLIKSDLIHFRDSVKDKEHLFDRELSDPREQSELLEILAENDFLSIKYQDMVRKSILLIIFSVFENCMRELAKSAESLDKSELKIKHLNNSGGDIDKCKLYLKLGLGVDFSKVNTQWIQVVDMKYFRNLIIHHHANLSSLEDIKGKSNRKKMEERLKKYLEIELRKDQFSILKDSFLIQMIENNIKFIRGVVEQLEKLSGEKSYKVRYIHYKDGSRDKESEEI